MNPRIFPNPTVFDPERWIDAAKDGHRLDKYRVAFGKGSRQCLGMKYVFSEFQFPSRHVATYLGTLLKHCCY